MHIIYIIILFILGTIFGSFGWVLVSRNRDQKWIKSIFFGRSKCPKCHKTLWFWELFPILSFVMQKWKCKKCGVSISNFYWLIELISGIVFVLTYLLFPYYNLWELLFWIIINWGLLMLLIVDMQKYELHLPVWIFTTVVSLLFVFLKLDYVAGLETILVYLWVFVFIYFFSKSYVKFRFKTGNEWMWQWDIFLALTIWALSWFIFYYNSIEFGIINLIDMVLIYVILSCMIGLIYAIINRYFLNGHKQMIPFLPAMIIAFWTLLLFWDFFIGILQ